jgi:hypothetical protein
MIVLVGVPVKPSALTFARPQEYRREAVTAVRCDRADSGAGTGVRRVLAGHGKPVQSYLRSAYGRSEVTIAPGQPSRTWPSE